MLLKHTQIITEYNILGLGGRDGASLFSLLEALLEETGLRNMLLFSEDIAETNSIY
jgi:hypothetical protein